MFVSSGVGAMGSPVNVVADVVGCVCVEVPSLVVGEMARTDDEVWTDVAIVALGSGLVHAPSSVEVTEDVVRV